jgi:protein-S-isoprenylcysteine O-methyltransferase Ste14
MQGVVLLIGTLLLTVVSHQSIRQPGTHGYYRFFAWELMLLLYVLNMPAWYLEIDGLHQVIAGVFFMISLFMIVTGAIQLRMFGKPNNQRNDVPMLHFEKTTVLVTTGIYRYIRHPIYGSLFFLCWGFFFKDPSIIGLGIAMVASVFLMLAAKVEEVESMRFFGNKYTEYMQHSKMLIPFIW